ncbi:MAG: diaminopropionate ammonia-lyase [Clostridia bacterium]|nr:diaminopropionate ammonia-lyase [Clostridia bacterium]
MKWIKNEYRKENMADTSSVGILEAKKAREFQRSIPSYKETPLVDLLKLSEYLGLQSIYVKDESYRFGVNSFKPLGGAYAIGTYIAKKMGLDIGDLPYEKMISDEVRISLGDVTFVSTTDGNHGRGVAWTANRLKQNCVIFMPKGSSVERLANVRAEGAEASITELNYDDTIRMSSELADRNGWVIVQDKDWEGYTDIPLWIMQGYAVMALEAFEELEKIGKLPTHVFLQAGVGSMASAVTGFLANAYGSRCPKIIIVESDKADCYFKTVQANDGQLHFVDGEMDTIMAGLACGEPTNLGWPVIRDYADFFVSLEDSITATGMRVLGAPLAGDQRVISGESGAVGLGLLYNLMRNPNFSEFKQSLELDSDSIVLCFSTEGDTDKANYRKIVWEGAYADK